MPQSQQTQTQPNETKHFQCRHIHIAGRRCRSLSLTGEQLCYYHHTTRGSVDQIKAQSEARAEAEAIAAGYPIQPVLRFQSFEDRACVQLAVIQVMNRIASGAIDRKLAGLLLYGLQIAASNLPREAKAVPSPDSLEAEEVEQIILDPELGPLAPIAEILDFARDKDRPSPIMEKLLKAMLQDKEEYFREQAALNQLPKDDLDS
jgi:hypothetical protein